MHDLAQFDHLGQARFSSDNGADRRLDWRLFLLQVFDFFDNKWRVLLGREPIDTVEENGAMVVRNQVRLPSLQKLFFEAIDHVGRNDCCWGRSWLRLGIVIPIGRLSLIETWSSPACRFVLLWLIICRCRAARAFPSPAIGRAGSDATPISCATSPIGSHWSLLGWNARLSCRLLLLLDCHGRLCFSQAIRARLPVVVHHGRSLIWLTILGIDSAETFLIPWPIPSNHLSVLHVCRVPWHLRPALSSTTTSRHLLCRLI